MSLNWNPRKEWWHPGTHFLVVVKHYIDNPSEWAIANLGVNEGPNRWNVYAYIYPGHPLFKKFFVRSRGSWPDICYQIPYLHGGVSYFHKHLNEKRKVSSYQVGSDYHHLHDNYFTYLEKPEEAEEVFQDAERLYDWLNKQ